MGITNGKSLKLNYQDESSDATLNHVLLETMDIDEHVKCFCMVYKGGESSCAIVDGTKWPGFTVII